MEGAWGLETDDAQFGQRIEYPLQFHALYSESRPEGGKVDFSQLSRVLARTGLGDTEIDLLSGRYAGAPVPEQTFYEVLHAAALAQDPHQDPANVYLNLGPDADPEPESAIEPEQMSLVGDRLLSVDIKPLKEGIWGFKHTVYTISGTFNQRTVHVSRRYSDFIWLLDYLVMRYTFRVLPVLPPKRVQVNGHYLSGDSAQFLARRKLGLCRFLNLLAFHPHTSQDSVLMAFLTDNSPLEQLKSRALPHDELHELKASATFIAQFEEKKFAEWMQTLQTSNERALVYSTNLAKMMAQQVRRLNAQAANSCNVTMDFEGLRSELGSLYVNDQENINAIGVGVTAMAQHFEQEHKALVLEAKQLQHGALEDIKYYRDVLLSVKELFKRYRVLGGNTVIQLKSRIERTRSKLLAAKQTPTQEGVQKLEEQLQDLHDQVKYQVNRSWLIKEAVAHELQMVQASQYMVSQSLRKFGSFKMTADQRSSQLSAALYDKVCDLPLH